MNRNAYMRRGRRSPGSGTNRRRAGIGAVALVLCACSCAPRRVDAPAECPRSPARCPERRTFHVGQFGAVGDGETDDWDALQRALHAAIAAGRGSRVALASGCTYRLGPRKQAHGALLVEGARGLTFEGNGATIVTHPSNRILGIHASADVVVRDLALDYDPLPFTQARMTAVAPDAGTVRFNVCDGYAPPVTGGADSYTDTKWSDCVFIDGETRRFTHSWLRIRAVEPGTDGEFLARFHGSPAHVRRQLLRTKAGDFVAIKMLFARGDDKRTAAGRFVMSGVSNVNISFSRGVRLDGIVSYAAPSMTFTAHGSERIALVRCAVVRKPGTDRLIAGNSDGCHLKSLTLMPLVADCRFEALMDDSIHVKISSNIVREVRGCRARLGHGDILYNDLVMAPGQQVDFYNWDERRHGGTATVTTVERVRYREAWVTFDRDLSAVGPGDLVYLRPRDRATVRGCSFGTQLKTGVVTHPPTLVDGCTFADVAYGVHAFTNSRAEGPIPTDTHVRECTFLRPTIAGIALYAPSRESVPPGASALFAETCRFVLGGSRGKVLTAAHRSGIVLDDLRVTIEDDRELRDLIVTRDCADVRMRGIRVE